MSRPSVIIKKSVTPKNELFYPMMLKQMTDEETKEYNLEKLFELSKLERSKIEYRVDGSIWKDGKPITEEPNQEQKQWIQRKMKGGFQ
jgi:hypothetical protein